VGEGTRRAGRAEAAEEAVVERGAGFAAVLLLLLLLLLTGEVILNGLETDARSQERVSDGEAEGLSESDCWSPRRQQHEQR